MSQIHILDGQNDLILDYVQADGIIDDSHRKSLEDTLETYDFIAIGNRTYTEYLEKRNRLIIPDEDGSLIEFVIFEVARYKDSEGHKVQAFSHASYLELKKANIIYPDKQGKKRTASQHAGFALNDTGWQVGTVEASGEKTLSISEHTSPYEFLKHIAKEYGVELRFRVEHDGTKITGRYVDLLQRVGEWRGREVEFGRDLDGIRRVEKQDIVTALLGLGPEREDGSRIEVLVEDMDALERWGRIDEHGNLKHLIEPYEIESDRTEMTEAEARQYTKTALNKRINTQVTYETTIVDLENVPGLENEKIRFGDTIRIKDTSFIPPLYLEARVFEQERSIKTTAKKDIKLGDFIEYTEEDVNAIWKQLKEQIQNRVSHYEMVEYTYNKLTIDEKDETIFEDGKSFAEAVGIDVKQYADYKDGLLKQGIDNDIGKVSGTVTNLNNYIDGAFKDGVISEAEAKAIEKYINTLTTEKAEIDNRYTDVYQNTHLKGAAKTNLLNAKTNYNGAHNELISAINTAIADGKTTPAEKQNVDNKFNAYSDALANLSKRFEQAIDAIAEEKSRVAEQNAKAHADSVAEQKANSALDQAKIYAVAKTVYENKMQEIAEDIGKRAPIEYVDGQLRHAIDGLEIGGRNLLKNSRNPSSIPSDWVIKSAVVEHDADLGENVYVINRATSSELTAGTERVTVEPNTEYTLSAYLKQTSNVIHIDYYFLSRRKGSTANYDFVISKKGFKATGEWTKITWTFKTPAEAYEGYVRFDNNGSTNGQNSKLSFTKFKLEKGNRATDWSPAPEDMFTEISKKADGSTVYTIEQIDNKFNNYVGITQYTADKNNIIQDLNSHGTRLAQNEKAIGLKADDTKVNQINNALSQRIGNVEVKADQVTTRVSKVEAEVDGLEIGGRNLVLNSALTDGLANWRNWGTATGATREIVDVTDLSAIKKAFHFISPNGNGQWGYAQDNIKVLPNTTYTASFLFKSTNGTKIYIQKGNGTTEAWTGVSAPSNWSDGNWHRLSYTWTTSSTTTSLNFYCGFDNGGTGEVWIAGMKLELGNRATDWTPAPEDTDGKINDVRGRVETAEGEIKTLAGEVALKANKSIVDSLEKRVTTAEGELRVLPGQINAKVSKDGVIGALNLSPETALIDFKRVKMTGELEAKHIKSLAGLNINDQFVVDSTGKVTIGNQRVTIDDKGIQIRRPDGAIALDNGLMHNGYAIGGNDPHYMKAGRSATSRFRAFVPHEDSYYRTPKGVLDGRGLEGMEGPGWYDVRDPNSGAMVFQRYEFIHSARYFVMNIQVPAASGKFSVHIFRDNSDNLASRLYFSPIEKSFSGTHTCTIDLGKPTFTQKEMYLKIGWANAWGDRNEEVVFRISRVVQTDFI